MNDKNDSKEGIRAMKRFREELRAATRDSTSPSANDDLKELFEIAKFTVLAIILGCMALLILAPFVAVAFLGMFRIFDFVADLFFGGAL